ncbi:MAG TPA: hypothetical protein VFS43_41040 [Polyangiaceae bacterium]|nr:hypothetical protein [Polyangiaceae bacterium]
MRTIVRDQEAASTRRAADDADHRRPPLGKTIRLRRVLVSAAGDGPGSDEQPEG